MDLNIGRMVAIYGVLREHHNLNDAMWQWYQSSNISRFGVNVVDDHYYFWTIMKDNTAYDITLFYNSKGIVFSKYDLSTGTNTPYFSIKGN